MKNFCRVLIVLLLIAALVGCDSDKTGSADRGESSETGSVNSFTDSSSNLSSDDLNDLFSDIEIEVESNPNASNTSSTESSDVEDTNENSTPEPLDPNAPTVYLEAERDGSLITVRFMVKNNPGVAAFTVKVNYDKQKVTPKTITAGITTPIVSNLQQPNATLHGSVTAVYANTKGTSENGEMFNITFEANYGATGSTKFEIIASEQDFVAPDYAYIIFQKKNIKISLS